MATPPAASFVSSALEFLCRSSYIINLLGLKIPLGLLVRASRARYVLAFLSLCVMPFYGYCHLSLLPSVQGTPQGAIVWHILLAMWVTIPTCVVGAVILSRVQDAKPCALFLITFSAEICIHLYGVQFLQVTRLGSAMLQLMFVYFEDLPVLAWIWCLFHVVQVQNHHAVQTEPQFRSCKGSDSVLVVGNAPTVTDGKPLGKEIDGFSQVARFNSYSVSKPEYTGSRVDYHFCNGRQVASGKHVKAVMPLFNASLTHAAYLFFPHLEEAGEITARITSSKTTAWFINEARLLELMQTLGLAFWQVPTSGAVAINEFLSEHASVSLHGFNFFEGKKIHYFEESPTQLITSWLERFVTHDPSKEKRWVAGLVRHGRANFLADAPAGMPAMVEKSEEEDEGSAGGKDKNPRQRPSLMRSMLRDGMPSQFSI